MEKTNVTHKNKKMKEFWKKFKDSEAYLQRNQKISAALKGKKKSKEHNKKNSESHIGQVAWNKGQKGYGAGRILSKETRNLMSKNRKGKNLGQKAWNKNKTMEESFGEQKAEELKEKISKQTKIAMQDPIIRKQIREARAKQIFPLNDTSIEIKVQDFLKQLGIEFYTHQHLSEIEHAYQCDILIPAMKLVIECDGDYWHNYPEGKEIDHLRTYELQKAGFRVIRLWEREIKQMEVQDLKMRLFT